MVQFLDQEGGRVTTTSQVAGITTVRQSRTESRMRPMRSLLFTLPIRSLSEVPGAFAYDDRADPGVDPAFVAQHFFS